MRDKLCWVLVLVLGCAQLGWADAKKALVLIYNSKNDRSVELQLAVMTQLKNLRNSGHFEGLKDFSTQFQSLDLNVPAYASLPKSWGMSNVPIPYLALMATENGKPKKLIWGQKIEDANQSLAALDQRLGLVSNSNIGVPGGLSQGPIPNGGPPGQTYNPGTNQPGYTQPGYNQPGSNQPGYNQPGYNQPGYNQPGNTQPGYTQPGYQPGYQPKGQNDPGGWTTFASPDGTFSVSIPEPAQVLQENPAHLWSSGTAPSPVYVFGFASYPGLTNANAQQSLYEYAQGYVRSAGIAESSRSPVDVAGYPGLAIVGVLNGNPIKSLLFVCPPQGRGYVLASKGANADLRFFTSFLVRAANSY